MIPSLCNRSYPLLSPMLRSSVQIRRLGSLLAVLLLVGCGGDAAEPPNPYHLTSNIEGDRSIERTWVEPAVEEVAVLASGDAYTLYNPAVVEIGQDRRLYVVDYGAGRVKAFTLEGRYLQAYGRGEGQGPGKVASITDVGVWRDSLVYVVDGEQRRVSYFNRQTGALARTENYEHAILRLGRGIDSTKVVATGRPARFLVMRSPNHRKSVSSFTSLDVSGIALDGLLHTTGRRAVYVPKYVPVLLTYEIGDTTAVATPTPDYGDIPPPKVHKSKVKGARVVRPPVDVAHEMSSLHDDLLSVQRPGVDSLEFDVYDTNGITYKHTMRLPLDNTVAVYGKGRAVAARDTTVHIYRVTRH